MRDWNQARLRIHLARINADMLFRRHQCNGRIQHPVAETDVVATAARERSLNLSVPGQVSLRRNESAHG
jgi:hypothetical protein